MNEKNFSSAAALIYDVTHNVDVPKSINLTITINHQNQIENLPVQMKNCYNQIKDINSGIELDSLWIDTLNRSAPAMKKI